MADPTPYVPSYSYSGWQQNNPTRPLPADEVDNDFAKLRITTSELIQGLREVRRSDGKLQNQIVTADSLAPQLSIGFGFEGAWAAGTSYSTGDGVVYENGFYRANVQHTASADAPPGDGGPWTFLFSIDDIVVAGALAMPVDTFTGDGSTASFNLSFTPRSANNLIVSVGGVVQNVVEYSVNGNVITFSDPPAASYAIEVRGFATTATVVEPADGSVTEAKLDPGIAASLNGAMQQNVYDPLGEQSDVYDRANHRGPVVWPSVTRAALKALDTTSITTAVLKEAGREGLFSFISGDYSAEIAADTQEGIYIEADDVAATSGAWVRVYQGDLIAEWFGAVSYSLDELLDLNGAASIDVVADQNSTALSAANTVADFLGGKTIRLTGQFYVLSERLSRSSSVYFVGCGVGEWEPIFPGRPKTWEGTTLLFKGAGAASTSFDGITSSQNGGGWREDPANPGQFIKLWTAYNSDSSGTAAATQKQFSVGLIADGVRYGGFQHLRACNWAGTDGISEWSNQSSVTLGDDWDFGYVLKNAEYADDYNIQIVGGWREAAHALIATVGSNSTAERNRVVRAKFNGRVGHIIRGPDIWAVSATTATTVTITWSNEIYFSPSGGTFRGSDNVTYTYTGVTHSGTDPNWIFTGVTPNPTGIFHVRHPSTGFGNTMYEDAYVYGLDHVSGVTADSFSLPYSKCLEASGFPLRGVKFYNYKCHSREDVLVHLHAAADFIFLDPQFEGGGYLIASPNISDQTYTSAPSYDTRNLRLIADAGTADQDRTLFLPRTAFSDDLQFAPRSDLSGNLQVKPTRTGKVIDLFGSDLTSYFRLQDQTITSSGFGFVTVTSQTCTFQYQKVGKRVIFNMVHTWSGLDTADTSSISIRVPIDTITVAKVHATVNDRLSTGINFSTIDNPYVDLATSGYLGFSKANNVRCTYNGGEIAASGALYITGEYWLD